MKTLDRHRDKNTELLTAYQASIRLQTTMREVYDQIAKGHLKTIMVRGERMIVWPALRVVVEGERAA